MHAEAEFVRVVSSRRPMPHRARIEQTGDGLIPADAGWFILNLSEMRWETTAGGVTWCSFEPPGNPSPLLGTGVQILGLGEKPGYYYK